MSTLIILGAQWGDEGKGKLTDFYAKKADAVVRFQGGNNAGHTVIVGDTTYKLHLVPSGVICATPSYIGSGMVVDPIALIEEIKTLTDGGVDLSCMHISARTHVVTAYHKIMDGINENRLENNKIGTTKRGIGPAYADKANRIGIRMHDLLDAEELRLKVYHNVENVNLLLTKIYDQEPIDAETVYTDLLACGEKLRPYICDVGSEIDQLINAGKKIVFEGAQGAMLDLDFGTYPFVTSSHPTAGGAVTGVGVGPKSIDRILGIVKAYTTRVGEGPFLTELMDETGDFLRQQGREYGTTTGRPRRCGWFDAAVVKYSARLSGMTNLAITKLDTLTGIEPLKICTHYELDGKALSSYPASLKELARCKPCYEELPGWTEDITKASSIDELPVNARHYLNRIEEIVGVKISVVSVGPERNSTIILDELL